MGDPSPTFNFFGILSDEIMSVIGKKLIGEPCENAGIKPELKPAGRLLFTESVFTRVAKHICPSFRVEPEWDFTTGVLMGRLCDGVSLVQSFPFLTEESVDLENESTCPEEVIVEVACTPGQNVTRIILNDEETYFDLEHIRNAPLPSNFTCFCIKTLSINLEDKINPLTIIRSVGSTLERIDILDFCTVVFDWPSTFSAIRTHCPKLHTFIHEARGFDGSVLFTREYDTDYATLLMSYGEQMLYADVTHLNLQLLRQVFRQCCNLKNHKLYLLDDKMFERERLELLVSRTAEMVYDATPSCHLELVSTFSNYSALEKIDSLVSSECIHTLVSSVQFSVRDLSCQITPAQMEDGIIAKISSSMPNLRRLHLCVDPECVLEKDYVKEGLSSMRASFHMLEEFTFDLGQSNVHDELKNELTRCILHSVRDRHDLKRLSIMSNDDNSSSTTLDSDTKSALQVYRTRKTYVKVLGLVYFK